MITYQILIEYDGTKFNGWQSQKNGLSVQDKVQKALKKIIKQNVSLYGSGRTDSGVHANMQSAHFKTFYKIQNKIKFIKTINFFLKKVDIVILNVKERSVTFHARHSAKKRTYKYLIINRLSPLILNKNRAWNLRKKLNLIKMRRGAKLLQGTKNFSTFRSSSCTAKSPIKTLERVKISNSKNKIEITFTSKSFLQQQVRSMVGCLKYLGEEKWSLKKFKNAMNSKKRSNCAPPAPPCGLYLMKIKY